MSLRSLLIAALFSAFLAGGAPAGTLTVTNTSDGPAPGPAGSLRRAINDASPGDTINFALPANSTVNLTSGELLIDKNLTINGPGANRLTVQRSYAPGTTPFRIFSIPIDIGVTISGLTISNGNGNAGGGILSQGTLNVINSTISDNIAGTGGGMYISVGDVNVTNCTISGNSARISFGGGIASHTFVRLNVANSTISGNHATFDGGGIHSFEPAAGRRKSDHSPVWSGAGPTLSVLE